MLLDLVVSASMFVGSPSVSGDRGMLQAALAVGEVAELRLGNEHVSLSSVDGVWEIPLDAGWEVVIVGRLLSGDLLLFDGAGELNQRSAIGAALSVQVVDLDSDGRFEILIQEGTARGTSVRSEEWRLYTVGPPVSEVWRGLSYHHSIQATEETIPRDRIERGYLHLDTPGGGVAVWRLHHLVRRFDDRELVDEMLCVYQMEKGVMTLVASDDGDEPSCGTPRGG